MAGKKLIAMHKMFGKVKKICGNCCHLKGDKGCYRKCELYGVSNSSATDWALSWQACGAFNLQNLPYTNIYKSLQHDKKSDEPIKGQLEMVFKKS